MFDGIYTLYMTGRSGNGIAVVVFLNGSISGADTGGGTYDGTYQTTDDGESISGKIIFNLPMGVGTISGVAPQTEPTEIEVPIALPLKLDESAYYRIETPNGPINTRFKKMKSLQ